MSVFIDTEKCDGCGVCVSQCPVQAISLIKNNAFINKDICNECLLCLEKCPNEAIYRIDDKNMSVIKRQDSIPSPIHLPSSQVNQQNLWSSKSKQRIFNRHQGLLDIIRDVVNIFFHDKSSFDRGRKGGRGEGRRKYGGHRKGHRRSR